MAFALTPDEEQKQQDQPQNMGSGQILSPGGSSMSPQGGSQAPAAPQDKGGNQFPDVSRYLTQNAPQAERLASKIGSNVVNAGNQAQTGIVNAQNTFNQQVAQNTVPTDQATLNRVQTNPTSLFNYAPAPTQPAAAPVATPAQRHTGNPNQQQPTNPNTSNPTHAGGGGGGSGGQPTNVKPVAQPYVAPQPAMAPTQAPTVADQAAFNQFQNMRNAQYNGPQDLSSDPNFGAINQNIANSANAAQQSTNDLGRLSLLRNLYGGGVSSPGVANLDNLLLQGHGSQGIIQNAASAYKDLPAFLQNAQTQAQGQSQAATAQDQATNTAAHNAITGAGGPLQNLQSDYAQRLSSAQEAARQNAIAHLAGGNQGNVPMKLQQAGFTPPTDVTTDEDYQKLQAINQLLGSNYGVQ